MRLRKTGGRLLLPGERYTNYTWHNNFERQKLSSSGLVMLVVGEDNTLI